MFGEVGGGDFDVYIFEGVASSSGECYAVDIAEVAKGYYFIASIYAVGFGCDEVASACGEILCGGVL